MKIILCFKTEKESADETVEALQKLGADIAIATDIEGNPMYLDLVTDKGEYEIHFGEYVLMLKAGVFVPCTIPTVFEEGL